MSSVYLILPCYDLNDFTLCDNESDGPSIVSAWMAAFDPENLLLQDAVPQWVPGYTPEEHPENALILMPNFVYGADYAWLDECRCNGCEVVEFGGETLEELIQIVHDKLNSCELRVASCENENSSPLTPTSSLANSRPLDKRPFYSVAFTYFVSEMVMRRLQYSSYTDTMLLMRYFQEAAQAWKRGDESKVNEALQSVVDHVLQSKECYFPTQNDLCDYCIVSSVKQFDLLDIMLDRMSDDTTLESKVSPTLFMSGRLIDAYKTQRPDSFERLLNLIHSGKTALFSGEYTESPLPMMTLEGILDRLYDALYRYKTNVGEKLEYFGRLTNGLTPLLPGILSRLGIKGVMYCAFDGSRLPMPEKCRIQWSGLDGRTVSAYAQKPFDVENNCELFKIPEFVANLAQNDYALGSVTLHQPGPLDGLSNPMVEYFFSSCLSPMISQGHYGSVLGGYTPLKEYFNRTSYSGDDTDFSVDEYKYAFLQSAIDREWTDPISRWARYYRCAGLISDVSVLESMSALLGGDTTDEPVTEQYCRINESVLKKDCLKSAVYEFDTELTQRSQKAAAAIAARLFQKSDRDKVGTDAGKNVTGLCFVNPTCQPVRKLVDVSALPAMPERSSIVRRLFPESKKALIELPPMGAVAVTSLGNREQGIGNRDKDASSLSTLNSKEPLVIQNNLYQLTFDKATGALVNVYDFHTRRNYFAQTLTVRLGGTRVREDKDDTLDYSISVADSFERSVTDSEEKMIVSGRLVDREMNVLYTFKQTTSLQYGSPTIYFDFKIKPVEGVEQDDDFYSVIPPHYLACRWAWGDDSTETFISVGGAMVKTESKELLSPEFVVNKSDDYSFTLKSFGLPWHRRIGSHRMDTLLAVDGETERRFHLEATIERHFSAKAIARTPLYVVPVYDGAKPKAKEASVLDVGAENLAVTSAWVENVPTDSAENSTETKRVLNLRLQETHGKRTTVTLEFFRKAQSACLNDFCGEKIRSLDVDAGRPLVNLQPYAWEEVQIEFA
ncbi:MAG: hypothetical protein IJH67_09820 [Thermoguttaceae bacterium]|nr:hypothetical protein [Thermoguttaceae bacterium]